MGEYDLTSFYLCSGGRKNTLTCRPEILSFRYRCVVKVTIAMLRFLGSRSRLLNFSSVSYCFIFLSVSSVYYFETFGPFFGSRFTTVSFFLLRRFSLIWSHKFFRSFCHTVVGAAMSHWDRSGVNLQGKENTSKWQCKHEVFGSCKEKEREEGIFFRFSCKAKAH